MVQGRCDAVTSLWTCTWSTGYLAISIACSRAHAAGTPCTCLGSSCLSWPLRVRSHLTGFAHLWTSCYGTYITWLWLEIAPYIYRLLESFSTLTYTIRWGLSLVRLPRLATQTHAQADTKREQSSSRTDRLALNGLSEELAGGDEDGGDDEERHRPLVEELEREVVNGDLANAKEDFGRGLGDADGSGHIRSGQEVPSTFPVYKFFFRGQNLLGLSLCEKSLFLSFLLFCANVC